MAPATTRTPTPHPVWPTSSPTIPPSPIWATSASRGSTPSRTSDSPAPTSTPARARSTPRSARPAPPSNTPSRTSRHGACSAKKAVATEHHWKSTRACSKRLLACSSSRLMNKPPGTDKLVHHSDAGSQYTSFRFTQHLLDAGIDASIGTVGDALDNALAESTIGLYKTELIKPRGPWHTLDEVDVATEAWVEWYNNRRLHGAC